jgi:hypothetical protein
MNMSKYSLVKIFAKTEIGGYYNINRIFARCLDIKYHELWTYAQTGDIYKCKQFLSTNNITESDKQKLLKIVVCNDHLELLKYFIQLWNIDPDTFYMQTYNDGRVLIPEHHYTLSWIASFSGSIDSLKYLIGIKADIKKQYDTDENIFESPLFIAEHNNQTEILKLFT